MELIQKSSAEYIGVVVWSFIQANTEISDESYIKVKFQEWSCMEFDRKIKSYTDIGKYALGKWGKILISIILYADLCRR